MTKRIGIISAIIALGFLSGISTAIAAPQEGNKHTAEIIFNTLHLTGH